MEQHVCLIFTGGTIGMDPDAGGVLRPKVDPRTFEGLLAELKPPCRITFVPLLNKDSTNITPADWTNIARDIRGRKQADPSITGFVIAHGTDTLHFTAAAIAFAFGPAIDYPIVFTGAQTSPVIHHGDARTNLLRAIYTALSPIAEVCIAFGD